VVERLCSRREEMVDAIFAPFRDGLFDSVAGEDAAAVGMAIDGSRRGGISGAARRGLAGPLRRQPKLPTG